MKRLKLFLQVLFHRRSWKTYREFKLEIALQKITPEDIQKAIKDTEIRILNNLPKDEPQGWGKPLD